MIINKEKARQTTLICLVGTLFAAQLMFFVFSSAFQVWNEQIYDRILLLKSKSQNYRPLYHNDIVHIDLNSSTLRDLNTYFLNRRHHAQVIRNLKAMNVSAQLYDFVFPGYRGSEEDRHLVEAIKSAGNVYLGMAFHFRQPNESPVVHSIDEWTPQFLNRTKWRLKESHATSGFYVGEAPIISFEQVSTAAKGSGFLNIKPDADGVFRRIPLLIRYDDAFYPSFVLRLICDHFRVPVAKLDVQPGAVVLKGVYPAGTGRVPDIVIPIDDHGNMRVNFVGGWERMRHYAFSDIYHAHLDPDDMELWQAELAGKIVLVSDVSAGSTDMGKVPIENEYPLSGIHANAVHTILNQSFLHEASRLHTFFIEILLLLGVAAFSWHRSALFFTVGSIGLAGGYAGLAGLIAVSSNYLLPIVNPLLLTFLAMICIHLASAMENARTHAEIEKAKHVAERELEIGSRIQAGFFPKDVPELPGWKIVPYFKSARQVSGDFYDVFSLKGGRLTCLVVADVCDKGVGAALFMALIRSLLRAFLVNGFDEKSADRLSDREEIAAILRKAVDQANDYIATTHEEDGMFATLFVAILEPESDRLNYINCGHESPVILDGQAIKTNLKPTGPALGAMPDIRFKVGEYRFKSGEVLLAFTDGLTDAENELKEHFTRDRLLALAAKASDDAESLVARIRTELFRHISSAPQFDDITMVALAKQNPALIPARQPAGRPQLIAMGVSGKLPTPS